jgi:hypothetical protein
VPPVAPVIRFETPAMRSANVRVHGTTHERPQVRFEREERFPL